MLSVSNLSKTYSGSGKKAVDDVSFEVNSGEIFGFLGPNGAGKTTTIKMITGILKKDAGRIVIDGTDLDDDMLGAKNKMAYVPDNPDVQRRLKGIEYINFMADMYGISAEARQMSIERYAPLFEMSDALYSPISGYSHGMQQKIVLMGALVTDPRVLILDEPMVGLDPKSAFNLKEIMRQMSAEGRTIFFSTHVLDVAEKFCDRVAIIKQGRLIAMGSLEDLRRAEGGAGSLEDIFLELTNE